MAISFTNAAGRLAYSFTPVAPVAFASATARRMSVVSSTARIQGAPPNKMPRDVSGTRVSSAKKAGPAINAL